MKMIEVPTAPERQVEGPPRLMNLEDLVSEHDFRYSFTAYKAGRMVWLGSDVGIKEMIDGIRNDPNISDEHGGRLEGWTDRPTVGLS